ncbi:MAG: hypothetical protein JJU40_15945 [Rhodobacteraceae bacterium]|nr:hypothetical protein [Paracoccaceae bacterium]
MNALVTGPVWPLLVLIWPLLLALVPVLRAGRAHALQVLPFAPLPALALALGGAGGVTEAPDLLLGVVLAAEPAGVLLLGVTALIWAVAGWQAAHTLEPGAQAGIFAGFWGLTLAGNLGVFLAADAVTFYVAFAAVSLAAWFLVIHDRTDAALAAGRVYIVMAVLGEVALLIGLILGVQAAGSMLIADIRAAWGQAPAVAPWLLLAGFGIKAGMVPLHVWLPLAHPAAPVPGSAVLSGAIVKAGLIGVLLLLPPQTVGAALLALGLAGAFGAALWGLTQTDAKAVLAYSTVSQMGLMLALAGAGQGAVAYYAAHHGLAKGALFLSVGAVLAATGRARVAALAVAAVAAGSVAGLPLSGGALAKAAAKPGLADWLAQAITASSVTTALVMGWFLWRLHRSALKKSTRAPGVQVAAAAVLTLAALAAPWALWAGWVDLPPDYALGRAPVIEALVPVLGGLAVLALVLRHPPRARAPGDLLLVLPRLRLRWTEAWAVPGSALPTAFRSQLHRSLRRGAAALRLVDGWVCRWPFTGTVLVGMALVLVWIM